MTTSCQRWRARRDLFRPAGEPFRPGLHDVAVLDELDAKRFTLEHHYSGSYPAARFRVGLFRAGAAVRHQLAGVAVFSVPMNGVSLPKFCGVPVPAGVDLGRFVLLDEVEGNGESWFLGRAFALLSEKMPQLRAVLSYSDPVPRTAADGRLLTPGHVGTIYQAHNGRYMGRSPARLHWITSTGEVVPPRALSKIRNGERGEAHVYEWLRAHGAPTRAPLESGQAYTTRALRDGPFRRFAHPGNHRYGWALGDRRERRDALASFAPAIRYPKQEARLA